MNDLLYFNTVLVSLEDVADVASRSHYRIEYVQPNDKDVFLDICHGGMIHWGNTANPELRQDRWIFECTNLDDYDLEEDRAIVEAYGPVSLISVQYRVAYLCELTKFLRRIIDQCGGRVYGSDNIVHDAATIEQMRFITGGGEVYIDCGAI